jgi:hypothetical protein
MRRYFIGLLLVIGLIIFLIFLIVHSGTKATVPNTSATLDSYANSSAMVSMTVDGPVIADQNHNQVQVNITNTSATVNVIQGYNGDVIRTQSYPNTEASYDVFLRALAYAGFTKGNSASDLSNEKGYCPTGDRYIFELSENGHTIERYWTTNCSGTPHSFDGDTSLVYQLFQQQIPDYQTTTENLNI